MQLAHFDPGHSEGHRLYAGLGEHQPHSDLHLTHVALCFRQKDQPLQAESVFI